MRQSALLVAALLAFAMLAPRTALAFEYDSAGSSNPDGSPKFVDPDENLNLSTPKADVGSSKSTDAPSNSTMLLPGLYLSGSANGNAGLGQTEGWMSPQPGRLTH
jgi:hypothetical protein